MTKNSGVNCPLSVFKCTLNVSAFKCLIRCDGNKILNIERCFMYMKKDKNDRKDSEELNFEA